MAEQPLWKGGNFKGKDKFEGDFGKGKFKGKPEGREAPQDRFFGKGKPGDGALAGDGARGYAAKGAGEGREALLEKGFGKGNPDGAGLGDGAGGFEEIGPGRGFGKGTGKEDREEGDGDGRPKGKGKFKGKFLKGKGVLTSLKHDRDPYDWEEDDFPKLMDRQQQAIQRQVDNHRIGQLRQHANRRNLEKYGVDPATYDRQWNLRIGLTAIENTTQSNWNVFIACGIVQTSALTDKKRLGADFKFTQSYFVPHQTRKRLKSMSVLVAQKWTGSYRALTMTSLVMDLWLVSHTGFNSFLGTCVRSLYDIANDKVYQNLSIKAGTGRKQEFDIGIFTLSATVSEVLEFTIVASNWQFAPRPQLHGDASEKTLMISMPESAHGGHTEFQTDGCHGPRYCWGHGGQFTYYGTKVSLSMEAIRVSILGVRGLQGKAAVSLGSAIDYPIAVGTVKALTRNKHEYVQGKVAGSLAITSRSLLLEEGANDEHPSIPAPVQPADALVLFHLSPKLQYLVVEMYGADALPIADPDSGTSNPLCRVKFDGMVEQSDPILGTTTPTWGHNFYLPVRLPEDRLRTDRWLLTHIMPIEMQSKGFLEIEIWHWDQVPTEFLGGCKLDLQETRICEIDQRALCQNKTILARRPGEEDADEDIEIGIDPKLSKKHATRVYSTSSMRLSGSGVPGAGISTVSFQCYFVPDFPPNFAYPDQGDDAKRRNVFADNFRVWDQVWPKFTNTYEAYFPDAPQGRRFVRSFASTGREELPLPMLVTPLALPASLATPLKVLHWIKCLQFAVPAKQRASGQISQWQQPADVLALHRGSVQDHAVLLCCALQGLGKQAYVCKGTLQGGKEHAWVMTREHGGTVTFWETTTGAKYHLPGRWTGDFSLSASNKAKVTDRWSKRRILPRWNDRDVVNARQAMSRTQRLKSMDDLEHIAIAPWPQLSKPQAVVVVPYESIEVVFNSAQLWGNVANHHPSCIFFDMEHDARSWIALIGEVERILVQELKDIALPVGPPMSEYAARILEDGVESELKESIRLVRMRKGRETSFEDDHALQEMLEEFLAFLESECHLDADWVFDFAGQLGRPWSIQSPFNSRQYVGQCRQAWNAYWQRRQAIGQLRSFVPVKENHYLSGIPMHLSSMDLREIRQNLIGSRPVLEYFELESDDCLFFVCAKVYPMPSTVASVWLFLGAEIPIPDETVYALVKERNQALQKQISFSSKGKGKGWGTGKGKQGKGKRDDDDDDDDDDDE